jgi:2-keto-4-pentenoate hydratase/2-oxohepta-3-ene-1,7-dioic acid hydratase in catechol pathway
VPSGVGFRREPPLLLGPGNLVAVEVDGVGRIENAFVEDGTQDPENTVVEDHTQAS